ncbi:MAG: hypothetical protein ACFFAS_04090 [Promethearchaeota archaeon]
MKNITEIIEINIQFTRAEHTALDIMAFAHNTTIEEYIKYNILMVNLSHRLELGFADEDDVYDFL